MRRSVAAMALVAAVAAIVLLPNDPRGRVPAEDASVFFYAARETLSGGMPYRDVWDHKPPLIYALSAVGLALAGQLGVWVLEIVALAGTAVLGLRVLARAFGLAAATFGTLAWLLAVPRLFLREGEQTIYVELFVLPLQVAALAIVASRTDMRFGRRESLALGALAALAALLKPTLVGTFAAIAILALWRERRRAFGSVAAMFGGGGAVLATTALLFAARGAVGDLIEQTVRYNLAYASFTPLVERLGAIPEGLRLTSPSGLAPLALAAAAYVVARRRAAPLVVSVAIVALPLELLLATSGRAYHYYYLPWVVPMGVLAAYAAREAMALLDRRRAAMLVAVALLAMSVQPVRLLSRLQSLDDDGRSRAGAAYVRERTAPGDTVLVWGSRVDVLFLAERRSPTRYVYQYAALATRGYATPAAIDALLADLVARPPRLIVDASASSFVTPPLDRAGLRAWSSPEAQYAWLPETERILAFVEANYTLQGPIPGAGWLVWRRR